MITVNVKSNVATTIKLLGEWDAGLMTRAARGLRRGLLHTAGKAQTSYLQGPRPKRLGEVTTALRRSITTRIVNQHHRITGYVGTNIPYAPFHEFGFQGEQKVSAHRRILKVKAGGKAVNYTRAGATSDKRLRRYQVRDSQGKIVGYKAGIGEKLRERGVVSSEVEVKAHTRKLNYAGRPFLRPAVTESMPLIIAEIQKEIAAV
jgi:phage gpG-like protein